MLIETNSAPFRIDRARSGRIRLARNLGEKPLYLMLNTSEAQGLARGIYAVLSNPEEAITSVSMRQGPPIVVRRQNGGVRLSRQLGDHEEWMSATDSVAADIAMALLDTAGGVQ